MKIILILSLISLIGCESNETDSEIEASTVIEDQAASIDVSSEYFGTYLTGCEADSDLDFGQGKITTIVLDAGIPTLEIKEYGESSCITLTAIRSYELAFTVETVDTKDINGLIIESNDFIEIEYISSTLRLTHTAYNGYNNCGFAASVNIDYLLNSPCDPNLDNNTERYRIETNDNISYNLLGSARNFSLIKQ